MEESPISVEAVGANMTPRVNGGMQMRWSLSLRMCLMGLP
jgi:hypothetical protein